MAALYPYGWRAQRAAVEAPRQGVDLSEEEIPDFALVRGNRFDVDQGAGQLQNVHGGEKFTIAERDFTIRSQKAKK
jgi:hypothetical protein